MNNVGDHETINILGTTESDEEIHGADVAEATITDQALAADPFAECNNLTEEQLDNELAKAELRLGEIQAKKVRDNKILSLLKMHAEIHAGQDDELQRTVQKQTLARPPQ